MLTEKERKWLENRTPVCCELIPPNLLTVNLNRDVQIANIICLPDSARFTIATTATPPSSRRGYHGVSLRMHQN